MGVFDHFPYTNFHELNLEWILKHFKEFIAELADLEDWRSQHETEYQELKELYDAIVSGNFPPSMLLALHDWLQNNAIDIIGEMVRFITVSINDNGYFVINIPANWRDIEFNTTELDIFTPLQPEYGHLTISY